MDPIYIPELETATLGLLVFLIGAQITRRVRILRDFNIPEPVTGGLIAAFITLLIYLATSRPVTFDLSIRDYLLVVFFSAIGLNARLSDLLTGGKPLGILLGLTLIFIVLQNLLGLSIARMFGMPSSIGVMIGSTSLLGGHGTAIAWAPEIMDLSGFAGATELGVASATIGLVIAALLGGPVAKYLIESKHLTPADPDVDPALGLQFADEQTTPVTHVTLMRTLFWLHVVVILGLAANSVIGAMGLRLPDFVPCMLIAIILGNLIPAVAPGLPPVSRTPALALVSDFALGTFLAISLMSMQLWTLYGVGLLMLVSMLLQTLMAVAFVLFVLFRLMGRDYQAAVLSAGFMGFSLGATPTAIANMNAVTKRYGPAPIAFVILPLVSAFFVDLANAAVIQFFLAL